MKKPIVEGHRGYCAKYPENTLISFEAALDMGVDAIEFDIWLTKDKVPVLIHDGNCLRTCGENVHVRDLTLSEVKKLSPIYESKFGDTYKNMNIEIPTFKELLELCKRKRPDIMLGVEIKEYTEETVDIVVPMLKEYGFFDTCCFYAFHAGTIKYLKTKYHARTMGYPDFQMREYEPDTYSYYDELGLNINLCKSELLPFYMAKGYPVHMYCADTEEDVRMFMEKGADMITANDLVPVLTVLGRI